MRGQLHYLHRETSLHDHVPPEAADLIGGAQIINLEDYVRRRREELFASIGEAALAFAAKYQTLPVFIGAYEHDNGDITGTYYEYELKAPQPLDHYAIPHPNGLSGGPETKRLVAARYAAESGEITTNYIHPRNLRFILSDLESQRKAKEYNRWFWKWHREVKKRAQQPEP